MFTGIRASHELDGVSEDPVEHRESVAHTCLAARQIDDERFATRTRYRAREVRVRCMRRTLRAYGFRYSWRGALEHGEGRFRRHIPRGEPGAAGCQNHIRIVRIASVSRLPPQ